jgi:hypothetical protein
MAGPSDEEIEGMDIGQLRTLVKDLNKEVAKLIEGGKSMQKAFGGSLTKIGETENLFKSMGVSLKSLVQNAKDFTKSFSQQYQLSEQLAKSYKQTSINIGIGYQNQRKLGEEFNKAAVLVQRLGGDMDDVKGIYTKFSQESGRVRILDDEEVERIFAIEKATGLLGDSAAALAERFDLIGVGSEQFAENINQIVKDSQKLGLNSSKVVQVLSDNFASMQRMSFRGGVKAMTEMSKLAVKMRIDISEMLGMADRFYEPEAAIEAAANLQLLGGEIANSFGDPLQMMFEARNAPEELMKRVGDVTQGLVKFNEETGQFDLLAENRQKLLGMADALGINKDQLIDTAFQMNKMQRIKMDVGGSLFDDEEKLDKIASIAKFDSNTQQWMVDIGGQAVAVEDLNTDQLEQALATPQTEEDAIKETAIASMTTNEHLEALLESTKIAIANETKFYERIETLMGGRIVDVKETMGAFVEAAAVAAGDVTFDAGLTEAFDTGFELFDSAADVFSSSVNIFAETIASDLKKLRELKPTTDDTTKGEDALKIEGRENDFVWRDGASKPVSFTGKDTLVGAKEGGPIDKMLNSNNLMGSINAPQKIDVGGTVNFGNITISLDGSTETLSFSENDKKGMIKIIKDEIIKGTTAILSGGYTDGKTANTNI